MIVLETDGTLTVIPELKGIDSAASSVSSVEIKEQEYGNKLSFLLLDFVGNEIRRN